MNANIAPIPDFGNLQRLLRKWNDIINRVREECGKIIRDLEAGKRPYTGGLTRLTELFFYYKRRALGNLHLTDLYNDFSQLDKLIENALDLCSDLDQPYYDKKKKREIREKIKEILKEIKKKKDEMKKIYPQPKKYNWFDGINKWIDPIFKYGYLDELSGEELAEMIKLLHRFKRYAMKGAYLSKFEFDLIRIYDDFEKIDKYMMEVRDAVDNIRRLIKDKKMSKEERIKIIKRVLDHLMRMLLGIQWYKLDIEEYFSPYFEKKRKKE